MKMSFIETLIFTNLGGIAGTLISVYFSDMFIRLWQAYWPEKLKLHREKRKIFTSRNRWFVKIRRKYGLFGIVALSPVVLSIPLGSFLTIKYYGMKRINIIWLIVGQICWSFIYVLFYTQLKSVIA